MAKTAAKVQAADRCELCGAGVGDARERARHLRRAHPEYARNVYARLLAPFVFLAGVLILGALHAPPVAYLVAMGVSYAFLFFGRVGSRRARERAGAAPTIGIKRMFSEGGLRFALLLPVAALVVLALSLAS